MQSTRGTPAPFGGEEGETSPELDGLCTPLPGTCAHTPHGDKGTLAGKEAGGSLPAAGEPGAARPSLHTAVAHSTPAPSQAGCPFPLPFAGRALAGFHAAGRDGKEMAGETRAPTREQYRVSGKVPPPGPRATTVTHCDP